MIRVILLSLISVGVSCATTLLSYEAWSVLNGAGGRSLSAQEKVFRRATFNENSVIVLTHNTQPDTTFQLGMNEFADLTLGEWSERFTGKLDHQTGLIPSLNEADFVNNWSDATPSLNTADFKDNWALPQGDSAPLSILPTTTTTPSPTTTPTSTTTITSSHTPRRAGSIVASPDGRTPSPTASSSPSQTQTPTPTPTASAAFHPENSVDWTARDGVVLPIRNQGACGSCYSFATVAAVEAVVKIKLGVSPGVLSTQQVIDCSAQSGCLGGGLAPSINYMKGAGVCAESAYPYTAAVHACAASLCSKVATISGIGYVTSSSRVAMEAALRQQPVAVAVAAGSSAWQLYASGIMNVCGSSTFDHAVLLVGYDAESGIDYWRLKNQWGARWGEMGFIRLARGSVSPSGVCGVLSQGVFPTA